jgi:hypothetical protein
MKCIETLRFKSKTGITWGWNDEIYLNSKWCIRWYIFGLLRAISLHSSWKWLGSQINAWISIKSHRFCETLVSPLLFLFLIKNSWISKYLKGDSTFHIFCHPGPARRETRSSSYTGDYEMQSVSQ